MHDKQETAACCESGHDHVPAPETPVSAIGRYKLYFPALGSLVMLGLGLSADHFLRMPLWEGASRLVWYVLAYIPVGLPVWREAADALRKGSFFNEFTLMGLATLGAFAIGEYPEGVAVMLFYSIGELFQGAAVRRAKQNIKVLLDVRPRFVNLLQNGRFERRAPEQAGIGDIIQVLTGQQIPLDGVLHSGDGAILNTAALTGESRPRRFVRDEAVMAGMLNEGNVLEIRVTRSYEDSALARILAMVQDASARKAQTELLIRRFAKVYTPVVFFLAVALLIIPYFIVTDYVFRDWLYRALVFLVISCPCALVISIPLGYFGGIGAASRHGILFKGANYLDLMPKLDTVVMDKTGTLTEGVFEVQTVKVSEEFMNRLDERAFTGLLASLEANSTHPVARAIVSYAGTGRKEYPVTGIQEFPGKGMTAAVTLPGLFPGEVVVGAGNYGLMRFLGVDYDREVEAIVETTVIVSVNGRYAGYVMMADRIRADAADAIRELRDNGVRTVMLSGDKDAIVQQTAEKLGIDEAIGGLLPEGKVAEMERLKAERGGYMAFVGDGINDAPVLAMGDVGIAMGGMGSDAAIESADVVIQTDRPSRIGTAIRIGRATRNVVIQNIVLAFVVKGFVLLLGAGGVATMWEAVFADVGVALLAILNAVRVLRMRFE